MMLDAIFLRHPRAVGESYVEHLIVALGFVSRLLVAAAACTVHAVIPALFERTASRVVAQLNVSMMAGRHSSTLTNCAFDYAI